MTITWEATLWMMFVVSTIFIVGYSWLVYEGRRLDEAEKREREGRPR